MSYFNTTNQTGQLLIDFRKQVKAQDLMILGVFSQFPDELWSPSQLYLWLRDCALINESTPLTSIRRSITNLTNRGLLEKTDQKKTGLFGRPEYLWKKV